ncbi:hypothetical protein Ancab_029010 [Ancistrocladus abbreviatus]
MRSGPNREKDILVGQASSSIENDKEWNEISSEKEEDNAKDQESSRDRNSKLDNNIANMNKIILQNHQGMTAVAIWEIWKSLGVIHSRIEEEVLHRIELIETRDKEGWDKLVKG